MEFKNNSCETSTRQSQEFEAPLLVFGLLMLFTLVDGIVPDLPEEPSVLCLVFMALLLTIV